MLRILIGGLMECEDAFAHGAATGRRCHGRLLLLLLVLVAPLPTKIGWRIRGHPGAARATVVPGRRCSWPDGQASGPGWPVPVRAVPYHTIPYHTGTVQHSAGMFLREAEHSSGCLQTLPVEGWQRPQHGRPCRSNQRRDSRAG